MTNREFVPAEIQSNPSDPPSRDGFPSRSDLATPPAQSDIESVLLSLLNTVIIRLVALVCCLSTDEDCHVAWRMLVPLHSFVRER